ncbi:hypothetical protein [Caloramator australicus]|jgi:acetyl-CoA carboxylase alpha subunit|uniref:Uncharacterized protein n=1 Tax=Caloramator australicus RC3 TaxID=857293 RepID=I7LJT0_9CLOT|nr:hypothetical protein [Caloramator australicus]CCJ33913.1 hypothetical protein CAAU_1829 [Caloramator australicus RC3]
MENEILLKAIEKLLDEKLKPIYQELNSINSKVDSIESTQQTILNFISEIDKEFYKVEETYKFMNDLNKVLNQ